MLHTDRALRLEQLADAIEIGSRKSALTAWIKRRQVPLSLSQPHQKDKWRKFSFEDVARFVLVRALTDYGVPPRAAGAIANSPQVLPVAAGYDPETYLDHIVKGFSGVLLVWCDGEGWLMRLDHPKAPERTRPPAAIAIDVPALVGRAFERGRRALGDEQGASVDDDVPLGEPVGRFEEAAQ